MILVETADTYLAERRYVLDFIFRDILGIEYELKNSGQDASYVRIELPNERSVFIEDILFQTPRSHWLDRCTIPKSPVPTAIVDDEEVRRELSSIELPLLFSGPSFLNESQPWKQHGSNSLTINFDLLGAVFFMLTRYEEVADPRIDCHNRYDSSFSLAVKNSFDNRPLVDEYIALLRSFLLKLYPSLKTNPCSYSVTLSHDLDRPYCFKDLSGYFKVLLGHIIKRQSIGLTTEWLYEGLKRIKGPEYDSFFIGLQTLLRISDSHGLRSQINIMATEKGLHDDGYDPSDEPLRETLKSALARGHSIGFHPGYHTYNDPHCFVDEKKRVEESLGVKISKVRQHYLRMEVPLTWRIWQDNEILEDGSLGFPDRNGFRAGTSHTYTLFDLENHCELNVRETPLIVMDGALKAGFNEALEPDEAIAKANHLADLCKKYGGTFSLLWHNSSFSGDWRGWERVYRSIVKHSVELLDD